MCASEVGGREKGGRLHGNSVLSAQSLCKLKTTKKKKESIIFKNSILFAINYTGSVILRIFILYLCHMNFFILFISTERAIFTLKFPPKLFNKIDDSLGYDSCIKHGFVEVIC